MILLANDGEPFGYPATQEIQNLVDYVKTGGALVSIECATDCYGGGGRTVVYANGRVYTRDYYGNLILDAATGSLLGSFTSGAYVTAAAPAIDQNNIVMLTWPTFSPDLTTLRSQSLADGSTRWTFTGDGQLDTAPIITVASRHSRFDGRTALA